MCCGRWGHPDSGRWKLLPGNGQRLRLSMRGLGPDLDFFIAGSIESRVSARGLELVAVYKRFEPCALVGSQRIGWV